MGNKIFLLLCSFTFLCAAAGDAFADKRNYVWTYEYKTMEAGEAEVEYYLTFSTPDSGTFKDQTTAEHQVELEVGMTDRFDFAIYQVFKQAPDQSLNYEGYKLRGRYRFGQKNQYVLDPLVYLEYKGVPDFSEHEVELKLVLAKDVGNWNFALNPTLEFEREGEGWETKPEYSAGVSYGSGYLYRLGIEVKGSENGHYIGPVISHGKEDLWVTLGSAIAVGSVDTGKAEFELRLLLGVSV